MGEVLCSVCACVRVCACVCVCVCMLSCICAYVHVYCSYRSCIVLPCFLSLLPPQAPMVRLRGAERAFVMRLRTRPGEYAPSSPAPSAAASSFLRRPAFASSAPGVGPHHQHPRPVHRVHADVVVDPRVKGSPLRPSPRAHAPTGEGEGGEGEGEGEEEGEEESSLPAFARAIAAQGDWGDAALLVAVEAEIARLAAVADNMGAGGAGKGDMGAGGAGKGKQRRTCKGVGEGADYDHGDDAYGALSFEWEGHARPYPEVYATPPCPFPTASTWGGPRGGSLPEEADWPWLRRWLLWLRFSAISAGK
jgi:hypothetical protein